MGIRFNKQIKDLSNSELEIKLDALKKELFELRYKAQLGTLEKTGNLKNIKRDVARILTVLHARNISQEKKI